MSSTGEPPWGKNTFASSPPGRHQPPHQVPWICTCCIAGTDLKKLPGPNQGHAAQGQSLGGRLTVASQPCSPSRGQHVYRPARPPPAQFRHLSHPPSCQGCLGTSVVRSMLLLASAQDASWLPCVSGSDCAPTLSVASTRCPLLDCILNLKLLELP